MWLRFIGVSLLAVAFCSADTLTLRSGRVITGQYLGGDARHIRMAVGDRVDTFNVEDVGDLEFSGEARQGTPPSPPPDAGGGRNPDSDRNPDHRPHDRKGGFQRGPVGPDLPRERG